MFTCVTPRPLVSYTLVKLTSAKSALVTPNFAAFASRYARATSRASAAANADVAPPAKALPATRTANGPRSFNSTGSPFHC